MHEGWHPADSLILIFFTGGLGLAGGTRCKYSNKARGDIRQEEAPIGQRDSIPEWETFANDIDSYLRMFIIRGLLL